MGAVVVAAGGVKFRNLPCGFGSVKTPRFESASANTIFVPSDYKWPSFKILFPDVDMYSRAGFEPGFGTAVELHPYSRSFSGVLPPIPAPRGAIWALLRHVAHLLPLLPPRGCVVVTASVL